MESLSWVADVLASYRGDARPAHVYVRSDGPGLSLTRDQLREQVARRAGALAERGVVAGDHVGLLAGEADAFMPTFLALLWLGGVAVPLPPPPSLGRRDAWCTGVEASLAQARPRLLCGPAAALRQLPAEIPSAALEELSGVPPHPAPVSVTAGYLGEPAPDAFRGDGWLRTGDLGYLDSDGHLYITGRVKDVLVTRGVSTDPHRVEWAAAPVPGVREGGVVAFTRPGPETEEVVVVAECANRALRGLPEAVRVAVAESVGLAVADVVRVPAGTIPKTTSGKPRRQETRRRYLAGELGR